MDKHFLEVLADDIISEAEEISKKAPKFTHSVNWIKETLYCKIKDIEEAVEEIINQKLFIPKVGDEI